MRINSILIIHQMKKTIALIISDLLYPTSTLIINFPLDSFSLTPLHCPLFPPQLPHPIL